MHQNNIEGHLSLTPCDKPYSSYQEHFFKQVDEHGVPVFHWVDTRIDKLSSMKLLDILHSSKFEDCRLDYEFVEEIKGELHRRNYPLDGDIFQTVFPGRFATGRAKI